MSNTLSMYTGKLGYPFNIIIIKVTGKIRTRHFELVINHISAFNTRTNEQINIENFSFFFFYGFRKDR